MINGTLTIAERRLMQASTQKVTFITENSPHMILPLVTKIISHLTSYVVWTWEEWQKEEAMEFNTLQRCDLPSYHFKH